MFKNILSAFAENPERSRRDEREEFSASADFAPAKRVEKIPLALVSGASYVLSLVAKVFLGILIVALLFSTYLGLYYLGRLHGIVETQEIYSNWDEPIKQTSSTEVVPSPVLLPEKSQSGSVTYGANVSWGGPDLWNAVNKKRTEFGVNPLTTKSELCTIASLRLNELLELGKLDGHEGFGNLQKRRPDLQWVFDKYSTIAEFLAVGGATPQETVSLWENTLGHRKLLDGGEYVWGCIYSQNTFSVAITAF